MLTEVRGDNSGTPTATPTPAAERPAWWARLVARVPLAALYGLAGALGWLTFRFFPYRKDVVRENLAKAFPPGVDVPSGAAPYCDPAAGSGPLLDAQPHSVHG